MQGNIHMKIPAGYHRALCEPWEAGIHAPWVTLSAAKLEERVGTKLTTSRLDLVTCLKCRKLGRE